MILSIYTSLLSILVIFAQSLYVIVIDRSQTKLKITHQLTAVIITFIVFSPWLIIMVKNWQLLQDNTTWMNVFLHPLVMIAIWFYSLATIFIEIPISLSYILNPSLKFQLISHFSNFSLLATDKAIYLLQDLRRQTEKPGFS